MENERDPLIQTEVEGPDKDRHINSYNKSSEMEVNSPKNISSEPISILDIHRNDIPKVSLTGRTPIFQIGEMDTSDSCPSSPEETLHFVFPDVKKESNNNSALTGNTPIAGSSKANNNLLKAKPGYLGGHCSTPSPSHPHLTSKSPVQPQGKSNHGDYAVLPHRKISTTSSQGSISTNKRMWDFTRRQWLTLVVFAFVEFFSAIVISLQAPFYPAEAEKKGATATEYGFVFGVFELTAFIVSPIYGAYMRPIGPKLVFNLGIFVTATCSILFGLLDKVDMRVEFISLSMLTRIFEALGDAAFVTASFVIIASEFPDSIATTFATMETFYGFGLIVGPTVGGALYQWGGYTLPFTTIGSLLFVTALTTYFVMPSSQSLEGGEDEDAKQSCFDIFKLLRVPSIAMSAFAIVSASMSIGFLSATLEPSLRQFNLSPVVTGLIFIASGGMYALSAPIVGYICDRITQLNCIMQVGSILIIIGFLLIGPAPFIPLEPNLWIVVTGLVIHGVGLGAALVAGFVAALRDAVANGFPDNVATYGVVSSIWTSMFALGSFVGPSVAGVLFDAVGFPAATMFIVGVQIVGTFLSSFFVCGCIEKVEDKEKDPLISKSPSTVSITNEQKRTGYGSIAT